MNRQQSQRLLHQDLARLRALLRRALHDSGIAPSPSGELRILDLACGRCDEAELLVETLPELLIDPSTPARTRLVGIDIRAREIADAAARCRSWLESARAREDPSRPSAPPPRFEFLARDATRVSSHRELGDDFDVVFLRHQNYWDGDHTWREIFAQGLEKLAPEGVLVCTSYFDREHALALRAIRDLGGEVILTRAHPDGRRLSTPGKVVDKHIAVIRRKPSR